MKSFIFTLIIGWAVWKMISAFSSLTSKATGQNSGSRFNDRNNQPKEGKTSIKFQPPTSQKISDEEGEYVDFEEVKD
jgi:hypothetical protein